MSCAGSGIPPTNTSPATTRAAKPPHGHPVNLRSLPGPSQRQEKPSWGLDREEEEEEQPSDTAVDAGSSEPLASSTLPKDNDDNDNGSEYVASSDEDPGPGPKRSRESARLRRVHAPTPYPSRSPISEVVGRKRSHSLSVASVPERTNLVTPRSRRRRVSKRPTTESHASQRPTHKPAHRADGLEKTGTPNVVILSEVIKRIREHNRTLSAGSPRQSHHKKRAAGSPQASDHSRVIPEPQQVSTGAGAGSAPEDSSAAAPAVKQFLTSIGLGQSHLQILLQEGIRTQQDLDGLQQMEKEYMVELRDVLRARGFTAFEFSKVEYAISRRKD